MCFSILIANDIKRLAQDFNAVLDEQAFAAFDAATQRSPSKYKPISSHERIFPNYWAPVITQTFAAGDEHGFDKESVAVQSINRASKVQRVIRPMRYRLRPHWSKDELPTRYNVFNARLDSLEKRRSWQPLFGQRHGLLIYKAFYEWVLGPDGSKKLLQFYPMDKELLWSPVLYDVWSDGERRIDSFAVITDDPPPEISDAGHDRCPIFLDQAYLDTWLKPNGLAPGQLMEILKRRQAVTYCHRAAS